MQLRPQPPIRFIQQAEDDNDNDNDNEDFSDHDRASPTPSAFTSSSLSSAPDSNHHMDSPDSSFGGPAESGSAANRTQHSAQGSSAASHAGEDSGSTSHSQQDMANTSASSSLGPMNLAEIFVFSSDPSSRPRGSLTALVHRGQSHPVSRGMPKKKRNKCTSEQLAALEEFFATNRNPTGRVREELSKRIRMPERSVQVWFQNKRAKIKTGDPKPDSEILADYAGSTTTSPITQLALAGIAARNKQLQLSTPAPQPPAPAQKTAEALPAFSLTVGSWRRLNPTLVIFFALKLQTFVSYVRSDSLGYKLDIPIQSVTRITFAGPDAPTQVEAEEGLEEITGRLTIEVDRAPTFFMEVFRSTRDGDANNKPSWRQCSDFTQDRQATKETTHYICGPYTELKKALANVVSASETVRSKISPEDLNRILGPDPPMPMMPFPASAQPPMPYLLPEQAQHFMTYPSSSMMNMSMSSHGHFDHSGPSVAHEGASSDTIMPRNSWRFENSMTGGVPISGMQQSLSTSHGQQSMTGGPSASMNSAFDWYGTSSTGHSSNSHSQHAPQVHRYGPTSSPNMHMHSQQHQLASIPLSLHGRTGSMSVLHGSPSFSTSYPLGSGGETASMYEMHSTGGNGGNVTARGYGSRSGYYSASTSGSGPISTGSASHHSSSGNLTGGAASSVVGTPHTSIASLSCPASESGRSFATHFASGFVGLGLDLDMSQSGSNSGSHHDARAQNYPTQEQNRSMSEIAQQQSAYPQSTNGYGAVDVQHGTSTVQAQQGGGSFVLPPRLSWSDASSGVHHHHQHFGSQVQAKDESWTGSTGGSDGAHLSASATANADPARLSAAADRMPNERASTTASPGAKSPFGAAEEVKKPSEDVSHGEQEVKTADGTWTAIDSRSDSVRPSSEFGAPGASTASPTLPRRLPADSEMHQHHAGDGGSDPPTVSKSSNASSSGTMMPHSDGPGPGYEAMDVMARNDEDDTHDRT
ncbi:hypothetical protein CF327_g5046 [Tilletia walkeri]|nr:hypothetical protein CF327_g5046 [Tilletia walkeri]